MFVMNLVTPKGGAKHELLFSKLTSSAAAFELKNFFCIRNTPIQRIVSNLMILLIESKYLKIGNCKICFRLNYSVINEMN